jgi:hypothetical protein
MKNIILIISFLIPAMALCKELGISVKVNVYEINHQEYATVKIMYKNVDKKNTTYLWIQHWRALKLNSGNDTINHFPAGSVMNGIFLFSDTIKSFVMGESALNTNFVDYTKKSSFVKVLRPGDKFEVTLTFLDQRIIDLLKKKFNYMVFYMEADVFKNRKGKKISLNEDKYFYKDNQLNIVFQTNQVKGDFIDTGIHNVQIHGAKGDQDDYLNVFIDLFKNRYFDPSGFLDRE